nr:MAG TPA: hypothetical protein [Caudoviricetes sp.]
MATFFSAKTLQLTLQLLSLRLKPYNLWQK